MATAVVAAAASAAATQCLGSVSKPSSRTRRIGAATLASSSFPSRSSSSQSYPSTAPADTLISSSSSCCCTSLDPKQQPPQSFDQPQPRTGPAASQSSAASGAQPGAQPEPVPAAHISTDGRARTASAAVVAATAKGRTRRGVLAGLAAAAAAGVPGPAGLGGRGTGGGGGDGGGWGWEDGSRGVAQAYDGSRASYKAKLQGYRTLQDNFGVAVLVATEETLLATGRMSATEFQKQFFKMRQQEFAPLRKANFGGLRLLGQELNVNDVPYFNFQSYIQWKLVSRQIKSQEERKAFNVEVGRRLLSKYMPNSRDLALAQCSSPVQVASASLPPSVSLPLSASQGLAWPVLADQDWTSKWPAMRASSQSYSAPLPQAQQLTPVAAPGVLSRPVAGSAGFVGAAVPPSVCFSGLQAAVLALLQRLRDINFVLKYSVEWNGDFWDETGTATMTVKLDGPADLEGGVLIRAEEDNFWQRVTSSMLRAQFEQLGVATEVDEYFSREEYKPRSLLEQAVNVLGDPLVPVVKPVDVDEVVETWRLVSLRSV